MKLMNTKQRLKNSQTQSSEISAKQKEIRQEIKDLDTQLFRLLTDKILESSPISEEQSHQWAAGQVIDKSALTTLKKQKYLEPDIRKDMAELYRLSGGRFGKCCILPRQKGQSRACAYPDQKNIHIGKEFTKKTLWHEMGHLFEGDGKYQYAAQAFLDNRVDKSKGLTRLSVLTGNKNYRRDEVAFTDHLFDAYVGKYYRQGVTEVLSMGVQQFSDPECMAELHDKDPDMFLMIAGLLATPPSESEKEAFVSELQAVDSAKDEQKRIDAFYNMLDKKIKANPDFYKPFAEMQTYGVTTRGRRTGTAYCIISNGKDDRGYSEFSFNTKSMQTALRLTYLYLALKQSSGLNDASVLLSEYKRYTQYDVLNIRMPKLFDLDHFADWKTSLPDIKAA